MATIKELFEDIDVLHSMLYNSDRSASEILSDIHLKESSIRMRVFNLQNVDVNPNYKEQHISECNDILNELDKKMGGLKFNPNDSSHKV